MKLQTLLILILFSSGCRDGNSQKLLLLASKKNYAGVKILKLYADNKFDLQLSGTGSKDGIFHGTYSISGDTVSCIFKDCKAKNPESKFLITGKIIYACGVTDATPLEIKLNKLRKP